MSESAPPPSRLSEDDRSLLRKIGSRLMRILQGEAVPPLDTDRRDELGILASMVDRAADLLARSRDKEQRQRTELVARVAELEEAHATQARLLETIRALSLPILSVRSGVLLVPIVGPLDRPRAEEILPRLLDRVAEEGAQAVIVDVTGATALDDEVAARLLYAAQAVKLLGAEMILCGISGSIAHSAVRSGLDLGALHPRRDLDAALQTAFRLVRRGAAGA